MGIIAVWNQIIFEPMINGLIVLYSGLFQNFGLTIIIFTIIIRLVLHPLTMKQLRSSKAMQTLQPKIQELQRKYAKDKQKLQQETMKLYKEGGINPMGCLVPMLVQLPIWIALYQSIIRSLAITPESLLELSEHLYSWPVVHQMVPLNEWFLGLNLAENSPFPLAILVGGTMWVQQKMVAAPNTDPKQQSMSRMMLWMMPIMFGTLTLQFPSGLALYWVVMNIVGVATQYFVGGWGGLFPKDTPKQMPWGGLFPKDTTKQMPEKAEAVAAISPKEAPAPRQKKRSKYGKSRGKRKDSRRSHSARPRATGT